MDDNRFTCPTPIPIFIRSSRISVGLNAVWWILNNRRMASVNPGLEVSELFDYWQDYPPTHVLVAGCLLGGNRKNGAKSNTAGRLRSSFDELSQAVYLAGGRVSQKLPSVYKV